MGSNKFSPQLGYEFIEESNILKTISELMKSLNWSGVACVDIRFDNKEQIFKVIEINTRYWRSLMGSLAAGVNFPLHSICMHLDIEIPKKENYFL